MKKKTAENILMVFEIIIVICAIISVVLGISFGGWDWPVVY